MKPFFRYNTITVRSRINESRFKAQNLVTTMEFYIKKSLFRVKCRFKKSECADGGHSLNRDFTVFVIFIFTVKFLITQ